MTTEEDKNSEVSKQRSLLFKNSSWMLIARVFRASEVVIRSIVVARSLGVEVYAVYAIVAAFTQPFINVFNANLGTSIVKFGTELKEENNQHMLVALIKLAYWVTCLLYALFAFVFFLGCTFFDALFEFDRSLIGYVVLFGLAGGATLFGLLGKALLALFMRFRVNTLVDLVITAVNVVVITLVAFLNPGNLTAILVTVACTMVFSPLVSNVAAFVELRGELGGAWDAKVGLLRARYNEYFRFTFGNWLARSLENATKSVDILILGSFASAPVVAVYDIARKLANIFFMMKDPIVIAAFPQVAGLLARKEYSVFKQLLASVYKMLLGPAIALLVLVVLLDDWILSIWGEGFANPGDVVVLTMCRTLVPLLCFWSIPLILSLGKVRVRLAAGVVSSVVGFGLALLLVQPYGGEGVAGAMLVGVLVNQTILMVCGLRAIAGDQSPPTNPPLQVSC